MKKTSISFLLFSLLLVSCSQMRFGHLSKIKSEKNANQNLTIKTQKEVSYNYNSIDSTGNNLAILNQSENIKLPDSVIVKTEINVTNIPNKSLQNILFKKTETLKQSSTILTKNKTENVEPKINHKIQNLATASFTLSIFGYFFFIFFISAITFVFETPILVLFGIGGIIAEVLALLFGAESLRMAKDNGQSGSRKAKFGIFAASIFLLILLIFMHFSTN